MQEQDIITKLQNMILVLRQGKILYGINAGRVLEVLPLPPLTLLPKQPSYLKGICIYKGSVVPVLSLRVLSGEEKLQGEQTALEKTEKEVCVMLQADEQTIGLAVEDVVQTTYDDERELPCSDGQKNAGYLRIVKILDRENPILVLNLPRMFRALMREKNVKK